MNNSKKGFWAYLEGFRKPLIKIGLLLFFSTALVFCFYDKATALLLQPLGKTFFEKKTSHQNLKIEHITNTSSRKLCYRLPEDAKILEPSTTLLNTSDNNCYEIYPGGSLIIESPVHNRLSILSPAEKLVSSLKVSFWLGLLASSPFWLYLISQFTLPALRQSKRNFLIPFLATSFFCIGCGICLAYFVALPIANHYLMQFNEPIGENFWSSESYINFSILLLLSQGLAFELLILLFLAVHFRILPTQSLIKARRYLLVSIFILSTTLNPPNVLTQLLMILPLISFYELAIIYSRFRSLGYFLTPKQKPLH